MSKTVIVLGGGIGGLSAAHELSERGFSVRVFELRDVPGGKARSVVVPSTAPRQNVGAVNLGSLAAATRRDLPGEHGFRFFPRFYRHVIDTMARIPYRGSRSVAENLVDTTGTVFARFGRQPLKLPTIIPSNVTELFTLVSDLGPWFGPELGIPPEDVAFFGERIWQILTSCSERRLNEYEKIGWWDFVGAGQRSETYQKFFGIGLTRSLVAAQAKLASTKTIGDMFVQYFFNLAEPDISADRVLNGPTNDVWIDPWLTYLRGRGVEYHLNARVRSIEMNGGVVRGVMVEQERSVREVTADYYVSALPIEVMATLVTDQVVRADPSLANIFPLSHDTEWMNGIQFYLKDDVPIGRGHQIYLDSPWALTSVSQAQFWTDVDLSRFGDGNIRGVISVVISDWDTPGLNGKPARKCTRREIRDEVWDQLKRSLNVQGADRARGRGPGPLVPGSRCRSAVQGRRRAAVRQSGRHVAAQAAGGDSHPESVPGLRLRPDVHRSGHHGGCQSAGKTSSPRRLPAARIHPRRGGGGPVGRGRAQRHHQPAAPWGLGTGHLQTGRKGRRECLRRSSLAPAPAGRRWRWSSPKTAGTS